MILSQQYGAALSSTDIDTLVTNNCNADTILCAAAGLTNNDTLSIFVCGNCYTVTTETSLNAPVREGMGWWYYTKSDSFGFSLTSYISQNNGDTYDPTNEFRLSWDFANGGYRAGSVISLYGEFTRYLFTFSLDQLSTSNDLMKILF